MDKSKWEYKKLGEVCANKKNIIRAHKIFSSSDEIIYIDISSINNSSHKIEGFTKYIVSEAPSRAQQVVVKDDVLYSLVRPNLKNIAVVDLSNKNLVASSGFCILRGEQIVSKFLYYTLLSNRFTEYILRHIAGANYPATKIEDVMNYGSYIPSISEQRIIVTELDQLNELISLKQQQLKEYDALTQSIFYEMFGNSQIEKKRIDYCVSEMHIGPFGSALKNDCFVDKDASYCMVYEQQHAIKKTMSLPTRYVDKKKYEELKRFTVIPGDIIMSCRGTIGELYEIPQEAPMGIIHPSLMKIRIKRNIIDASYFLFFMRDFIKEQQSNGATIKMAITAKALSKELIPLPPLTLQQSFAERVRAIERQKALVKQSIAEVQTLLDSRMQEYFG